MTEEVQSYLKYGFEIIGLDHIVAITGHPNLLPKE
jgi:hypothetical protein